VPGVGPLVVDVAFGGNFYALIPAERLGIPLEPAREQDLIRTGMAVIAAADAQVAPGASEDDRIRGIEHLVVTAPGDDGAAGGGPVDGRSATVIHPGWIDRSPCGTGTSARMALLHHRGRARPRHALRARVVHRLPLRGPLVATTTSAAARGRPDDPWARLDQRTGGVRARPDRPVPRRLPPLARTRDPHRQAMSEHDVVVIGSGVVGASCAFELALAGDACSSSTAATSPAGRPHRARATCSSPTSRPDPSSTSRARA
jgi:hypothetical protein